MREREECVRTWERTGFTGLLNRHMADRLGTPYLQKILNQVRFNNNNNNEISLRH